MRLPYYIEAERTSRPSAEMLLKIYVDSVYEYFGDCLHVLVSAADESNLC